MSRILIMRFLFNSSISLDVTPPSLHSQSCPIAASTFSSVKIYNMHSCSHCCNPASIIVTGNETGLLFLPALLPCEQVPSLGSPESADSTTNVTVEVGSFQTSTINGLGNQLEESLACIFFSFYYFTRIKQYTIESFQCPRFLSLLP